jgi:hypothetical protein
VQGQSLDELEKQLEESRQILGTMKDNVKGDILQNLITVVLASDDDGDMLLDDGEIEAVTKNIEGLQGIELPDGKLKKLIIAKGRCVSGEYAPRGGLGENEVLAFCVVGFHSTDVRSKYPTLPFSSFPALMEIIKTVVQSENAEAALSAIKADIEKMDRGLLGPVGVAA